MKKSFIAVIVIMVLVVSLSVCFIGCDTSSSLKGFDIDLAREVAKELGLTVKFQKISWDSKEFELAAGNIDMIWNGMTINESRMQSMAISSAYLSNEQVCVIKKSNASVFTSKDNIANAKFVAEKGSAGVDAITDNFGTDKLITAADQIGAMTEVLSGSSDIAVIDSTMANYYCNQKGSTYEKNLMVIDNISLSTELYGIGLRKTDIGTLDKVNTALSNLYANGKLKQIADNYSLGSEIVDCTYTSVFDTLTEEQKSGWNKIVAKGKFVVGYTLYAPIAF